MLHRNVAKLRVFGTTLPYPKLFSILLVLEAFYIQKTLALNSHKHSPTLRQSIHLTFIENQSHSITPMAAIITLHNQMVLISVEDLLAKGGSCITDLFRHAGPVDIHEYCIRAIIGRPL